MPMHFVVRAEISAEITRMAVMRFGQHANKKGCRSQHALEGDMQTEGTVSADCLCPCKVGAD